jgi:hypothetical protein
LSTLPFWLNTGDLFAYGLFTLLYATLGLGLNVVVGFAGLLDLGYVAYFESVRTATRSSRRRTMGFTGRRWLRFPPWRSSPG